MPASPSDLEALLAAVGPRLDGLVDRAVGRAKGGLAEYYVDVSAQELRDGILADLGRAISALADGRRLTDEDRAGMGQIGDARARQGVPLEVMLQVYRFTVDEIFNELWAAAEEGDLDEAQVGRLTRDIWQYADPMMDVAVQAYRTRELQQAVADTQGRTALVHSLLLTPGGASSIDAVLGAHLDRSADYVAIRARATNGKVRELLLELQMPGVLDGAGVAPHESDVIGYARARPNWIPPTGVIVGVGPAGPLAALPHSLAVATRVLETAVSFGIEGVRTLEQVGLQAIARSEDVLLDHLIERLVGPCEPATTAGRELLDTVEVHLASDLSVEVTAAALFVHANTVRNRLRRYELLTGASLRSVDDLVAVRLALLRWTHRR